MKEEPKSNSMEKSQFRKWWPQISIEVWKWCHSQWNKKATFCWAILPWNLLWQTTIKLCEWQTHFKQMKSIWQNIQIHLMKCVKMASWFCWPAMASLHVGQMWKTTSVLGHVQTMHCNKDNLLHQSIIKVDQWKWHHAINVLECQSWSVAIWESHHSKKSSTSCSKQCLHENKTLKLQTEWQGLFGKKALPEFQAQWSVQVHSDMGTCSLKLPLHFHQILTVTIIGWTLPQNTFFTCFGAEFLQEVSVEPSFPFQSVFAILISTFKNLQAFHTDACHILSRLKTCAANNLFSVQNKTTQAKQKEWHICSHHLSISFVFKVHACACKKLWFWAIVCSCEHGATECCHASVIWSFSVFLCLCQISSLQQMIAQNVWSQKSSSFWIFLLMSHLPSVQSVLFILFKNVIFVQGENLKTFWLFGRASSMTLKVFCNCL